MNIRTSLLLAALGLASASAAAVPTGALPAPNGIAGHWQLSQGFIVRADDRFDPFIQRLLAEESLKALPLRGGQLFYIVPVNVDPGLEEMQIRYLELLLDRQEVEPRRE